ncbi:MAG TPA: hypothetical protein VE441_14645 [Mycobacterium sp.]|nr:hypothetical protein [Mycobacterium sp.]
MGYRPKHTGQIYNSNQPARTVIGRPVTCLAPPAGTDIVDLERGMRGIRGARRPSFADNLIESPSTRHAP